MARVLHQYLVDEGVHSSEIQPCLIGKVYVHFTSHLERERFLGGQPRILGQYQLGFIKHDKGKNFCSVDMDRVVWLMLIRYPPDGRSVSTIAKSISSFASLVHVHPSVIVARITVQALVNREQDIFFKAIESKIFLMIMLS